METTEVEISREDFNEWKDHKVTQAVMKGLGQIESDLKEFLAAGGTVAKDAGVSTEFVVGRLQGLRDFLMVEYEEDQKERQQAYDY